MPEWRSDEGPFAEQENQGNNDVLIITIVAILFVLIVCVAPMLAFAPALAQ